MKKHIVIVLLFISCCVSAETLTATVESWNSASLSGDVMPAMDVSFTNSSHSSNRVGEGQQAVLTLTNLPHATVSSITLYMHSNSSSGGATVTLKIDNTTIQVADGLFRDWKGMSTFTTSDQPITALSKPLVIPAATSLTLTIDGTTNSVYLTSLVVNYTPVPKQPAALTLHYIDASHTAQIRTIREDSADSGWTLPVVEEADEALVYGDTTWHWLGWCEQAVGWTDQQPDYYAGGQHYTKGQDADLYAIYTNCAVQPVDQATQVSSGEYILVRIIGTQAYAIWGAWQDKRLRMQPVVLVDQGEGLQLACYAVDDSLLYNFSFEADSVFIKNMATSQWIGYNSSSASSSKKAWKVLAGAQNTFHFQSMTNDLSLCWNWDIAGDYYYGEAGVITYNPDEAYWYLFSADDLPKRSEMRYTTCPVFTGIEVPTAPVQVRKILDHQGHIRILNNQQSFNLIGQRL